MSFAVSAAHAQFQGIRPLNESEKRQAIAALLADPQMPMADEPSCKADLSKPGRVVVAEALAEAIARAAAERPPRVVRTDCFERRGYPKAEGQEYCRLAFLPQNRPRDIGFGIVFLMDWPKKAVVADSAECY
jgi:hypothetical protein